MSIKLEVPLVAASNQVSSELGSEAIILGLGRGMYYGLNSVGTRVWQLLKQPVTPAGLRDQLIAEYEVEPSTCQADLLALLEQLFAEGLIEVADL